VGATSIAVAGVTATTGTAKKGDYLTITGHSVNYPITANATADGSGNITLTIASPGLVTACAGSEVCKVNFPAGSGGTAKGQQLVFHRNALALAMAPLTDMPRQLGAQVATVFDDVTNLALRSRVYYDGANSTVYVALDVLYGVAILDQQMGCRISHN
jgi:hypothetical protein